MKIYTKILAVLALTMLVAAPLSAQKKSSSSKSKAKASKFYVGGSIGLSFTQMNDGQGNGDNSKQSGASYRLLPEFGFNINKKLSAGVQAGLVKGLAAFGSTDPSDLKSIGYAAASAYLDVSSDTDFRGGAGITGGGPMRVTGFRFAPYVRYTLLSTKSVDLFVDGVLAYTTASQQNYGPDPNNPGQNIWDGNTYNIFEIAARPGFLVKFTDRFSLIGRLGAVGFSSLKLKDSEAGMTRFGVDMDTNNMLFGFVINL